MKKFLLIIPFLFLTSCVEQNPNLSFSSISSVSISLEIEHEYSEITDYRINWDEIFNVGKDNYYVYLFSITCSHCSSIKNKIIEFAINNKDIYFVEDCGEIIFKNDVNYTIGLTSTENLAILGFPSLLKITNKILTKNVAGTEKIITELKL